MKAHFTIYVLFLLIVSSLYSCKSAKLSDAEEKQRIGEYYEAAAIYRKVYTKTSPKKRDLRGYIAYRMAECNRLINNTAKATSAYMNAIRYDYPDSTVYLRMGQMLQKTGRYPEAIKNYDIYMENDPSNLLAINGIQGCELAPGWKKNPTRYEVRRINSIPAGENSVRCWPEINTTNYTSLLPARKTKTQKLAPSPGKITITSSLSSKTRKGLG